MKMISKVIVQEYPGLEMSDYSKHYPGTWVEPLPISMTSGIKVYFATKAQWDYTKEISTKPKRKSKDDDVPKFYENTNCTMEDVQVLLNKNEFIAVHSRLRKL